MWYWAGDEEAAVTQSRFTTRRRVYLPPYTMQELKVDLPAGCSDWLNMQLRLRSSSHHLCLRSSSWHDGSDSER
jgi:hypothetical protein